jgi:predicted metalloprotease with PDZ domain
MRTTRFTVAMPRPETHLYEITMEVDPRGATTLDLVLPVWTPGSYLVREFARHVRDFSAKEKGGRRPIPAEKVAKNTYDELVDSPFECGTHRTFAFSVRGVPHALAIWGRGNEDAVRLVGDLKKLVGQAAALFGGLPYERYLFLVHLAAGARGGLEHRASQSVALDSHAFRPEKAYRGALLLFSHELFHAWNVKRIRPEAFGPFDYGREVHTKDLWALEGLTSYYEVLLLLRAGLLTEAQAFEEWATQWKGHLETPGRTVQSAEMASFDTWIRFYRPDENSVNVAESYYRRGALLGLALDLTLRRATSGRRGLDDVFRELFRTYAAKGRGYPPGAVEDAAARVAGSRPPVRVFFDRYVRGAGTPDLARLLKVAGLRLREVPEAEEGVTETKRPPVHAHFGWKAKAENGRLVVAEVLAGGPAQQAGVNAGDVLVAVDGFRASEEAVSRLEKERKPGTTVVVTVFRRDLLETHRVRLGRRRASVWRIDVEPEAPAGARRVKKRWLGARVSA